MISLSDMRQGRSRCRLPGVPNVCLLNSGSILPPVATSKAEEPIEAAPAPQPTVAQTAPVEVQEPQVRQQSVAEEVATFTQHPTFQPFNLTIRTNLLSWATLTPGFCVSKDGAKMTTGSTMPNLELEYAFGG